MINQLYRKQWQIICVTLMYLGVTDGYAAEEPSCAIAKQSPFTKTVWYGMSLLDEDLESGPHYACEDGRTFSTEIRLTPKRTMEYNNLGCCDKNVQKKNFKTTKKELIQHTASQLLFNPQLYDYASHKKLYRRNAIEKVDSSKELSTANEDICITKKYKKYISSANTKYLASYDVQTNESIRLHKTILEADTINFTLGKCLFAQQCYLLANRLVIKSISDRSRIQTIDITLDKGSKSSIEGIIDFHNNTTITDDTFFKFGDNGRLVIRGIENIKVTLKDLK